ncbi:MAG TPA: YdcF family protein [Casimicrobiaceae bacterium]|nr:YdcF family protein [Casimicrobiaceae bacterium]
MEDLFRWKLLLKALVLPPAAPLLIALVGLALLDRHRRLGRFLATLGVVLLVLVSLPAVAAFLIRFVDDSPPFDASQAKAAQAIVILGGGTKRAAPEYGGDTLNRLTLERVRYGARVARLTGLPVMVVGGRPSPTRETEAKIMQDALQNEFGVTVHWTEEQSTNTHENALMAAAILRPEGVRRIVLVAHTFDMPRATAEFAAAGLATIPAPTGVLPPPEPSVLLDYVPSVEGLQGSYYALYELYANAARHWRY